MNVDSSYLDWTAVAGIYAVLLLVAFLWWNFNTKSKNKPLEILSSVVFLGSAFIAIGLAMVIIDALGPFTLGQIALTVGLILFSMAGMGWLILVWGMREEAQ